MAETVFIHSSAVVEAGAQVGEGTRIWHFSHVMPRAVIGKDCNLGMSVFVDNRARLGDRVKVQNHVSIYNGVELGDDVFCGPSCVFTNVVNPRAAIERKDEFRPTRVGRGATIGANATIVCGHDIGEYAFVAAGAVVTRPVPSYALVAGVPAKRIGWVCQCGQSLRLTRNAASCPSCTKAYEIKDGRLRFAGETRKGGKRR